MTSDLIALGCVPRKSLILRFPTKEQVPQHLIKHFIRGYFDGDGSIGLVKKHTQGFVNFVGTKNMLLNIIKNIEKEQGSLPYTERLAGKNSITYAFDWRGNKCLNMGDYLYRDCNIKMERKWIKFLKIINRKNLIAPRYWNQTEKQREIINYYTPFLQGVELPKYKWET
jgi:intein-encoded DNA endonuclease-like protein